MTAARVLEITRQPARPAGRGAGKPRGSESLAPHGWYRDAKMKRWTGEVEAAADRDYVEPSRARHPDRGPCSCVGPVENTDAGPDGHSALLLETGSSSTASQSSTGSR